MTRVTPAGGTDPRCSVALRTDAFLNAIQIVCIQRIDAWAVYVCAGANRERRVLDWGFTAFTDGALSERGVVAR